MFDASTIMTKTIISVKKDTDIYEAIRILVENNITGLPVVNDDMTLAGIISEKDVLSLLSNAQDKPGNVEDYMTKDIITFNEKDSLIDIADCFINHHFRRVPILSDGKLAGLISRKDIIKFILHLRHKDNTPGK
jgi:CBS domain-containing protein